MATINRWTWMDGFWACFIQGPSLTGYVFVDYDDRKRIQENLRGKLYLMKETSGRVYCLGRFQTGSSAPVPLHRWLMDAPRGKVVHHINSRTLDNRRENLEITTQRHNIRERDTCGKSGHKHVYQDRGGKFYVAVTAYGYDTLEDAAAVAQAMRDARDSLLGAATP